jgi:hypothetical protein
MFRTKAFAACTLALALAACSDSPTGQGNDARVQVRFGVAGSQASQALLQTSGTDQLVITGANGTLTITDIRLVVAEFELDGDDDVNPCAASATILASHGSDDGPGDDNGGNGGDDNGGGDDDGPNDDCEDFNAGPLFVDLPLAGGPITVASGDIPAGVYREVEFEAEDLDDDEEDPAEAQRIAALRQQILAQFPDWPRDASMLVTGTFTPTGGQPVQFRTFIEAEIEIELALNPPLTVGEGATGSLDITLDPAVIFKSGGNVLDLSQPVGEIEIENRVGGGFSGRGHGSDD